MYHYYLEWKIDKEKCPFKELYKQILLVNDIIDEISLIFTNVKSSKIINQYYRIYDQPYS